VVLVDMSRDVLDRVSSLDVDAAHDGLTLTLD
jgi:hypothetical protein